MLLSTLNITFENIKLKYIKFKNENENISTCNPIYKCKYCIKTFDTIHTLNYHHFYICNKSQIKKVYHNDYLYI